MSDRLHPTMLRWVSGRGGVARRDGVEVRLEVAPDLGRGPVHEVWFDPALPGSAYARDLAGEHLLDDAERAAALRLLREIQPG